MASSNIVRLNYKSNAFHVVVGLLCVMVLIEKSGATDFAIAWKVPTDPSVTHFNQWAENTRFQIGDAIVFNYPPGQDSVLRVSQDDYTNCNTNSSTAEKFTDGHTVYKFTQSGPFYFISGNGDNCQKNEKVVVIVLADRTNRNAASPPSPAPSSAESPPPAPSGTAETPSPESSIPPPPPSAASSVFVSLVGSIIGAFAASSTLLLV